MPSNFLRFLTSLLCPDGQPVRARAHACAHAQTLSTREHELVPRAHTLGMRERGLVPRAHTAACAGLRD